MGYIGQTGDLSSQYLSFARVEDDFRPVASTVFTPGLAVQLAAQDLQIYPDQKTVKLTGTGASQQLIVGVVSEVWPGFNAGIGSPNYTSASSAQTVRGTQGVLVVTAGFHPGVFVDQSGTGATAVSNGTPLVASRATAGYAQGATAPVAGFGTVGVAMLPAAGFASTALSAASLVQASQTATIAGTPAVGDTLSVTIQMPYTTANPGVAQTTTFTTPALTTAQAVSTTTAATALAAYLNAQTAFSTFYTATPAAAVVTVAVNTAAAPFLVTYGSGIDGQGVANQFTISLSGIVGNAITFACAATGGSTNTAGSTTLASGAGFKGTIPALVA